MARSRFVSKAMIAEHQARNADEALAQARALIKRLKADVQIQTAIGEPAASIVAFANRHRCTGIVMGSRGQGRIAGLGHSITYRVAVGPRAGQKVLSLQTVPARADEARKGVAQYAGFSLHAGIGVEAEQRGKFERL